MKTVFVDPGLCIGCRQCEFACAVEHSKSKDPYLALFEDPTPHTRIHVEPGPVITTSFPNRCRHCDPAPCQQVCPAGAISRDEEFDLVLVDQDDCIACAMCAMVCPFDAVTFHPAKVDGTVRVAATKCDGCIDRLRAGDVPACVEACKVGALVYGEVNELVAEGRLGQAAIALTAATPEERPLAPIEGWRDYGRELTTIGGRM